MSTQGQKSVLALHVRNLWYTALRNSQWLQAEPKRTIKHTRVLFVWDRKLPTCCRVPVRLWSALCSLEGWTTASLGPSRWLRSAVCLSVALANKHTCGWACCACEKESVGVCGCVFTPLPCSVSLPACDYLTGGRLFLKLALAVIYERKKWQGLHEGRKHTWAHAKNTHAHRSVMLERHANRISLTLFIIQLMILWKWAAAWISLMNSTCVCHLNEVQLMCTHTAHMHAVSLTGLQWWMKGSDVFSAIIFFNSNILKLQLQLGFRIKSQLWNRGLDLHPCRTSR